MIRRIDYSEWVRRVNQLLDFCIDRRVESFTGIFWEELYNAGYNPLEVSMALIEEYQLVLRAEEFNACK